MKKTLMLIMVGILVLGTMAMSFADTSFGPAQIFADLLGITEEEAYDMKLESGKTFGTLAEENGVYDAFLAATLEAKTAYVNDLLAQGKLTQTEADEILANIAACDGTQQHLNQGIFGQKYGNMMNGQGRQGMMNGQGRGAGQGNGTGQGRGTMMNGGVCNGTGLGVTN